MASVPAIDQTVVRRCFYRKRNHRIASPIRTVLADWAICESSGLGYLISGGDLTAFHRAMCRSRAGFLRKSMELRGVWFAMDLETTSDESIRFLNYSLVVDSARYTEFSDWELLHEVSAIGSCFGVGSG